MGITPSLLSRMWFWLQDLLSQWLAFPPFPKPTDQLDTYVSPLAVGLLPVLGGLLVRTIILRHSRHRLPSPSSAACRRELCGDTQTQSVYNFSHISLLVAHQRNNQSTE